MNLATINNILLRFEKDFKTKLFFGRNREQEACDYFKRFIEVECYKLYGRARSNENRAWVEGKRCRMCGRSKEQTKLTDTCGKCLEEG